MKKAPKRKKLRIYHNRYTSKEAGYVVVILGFAVTLLFWAVLHADPQQAQSPTIAPRPRATQASEENDPICGLTVVECPNEQKADIRWRTVTAFNAVPEQTDFFPCLSANGTDICAGMARGEKYVATNELPFGAKVKINGEIYTVVDRTSSRYDHRYDIAFPADQIKQAKEFGDPVLAVELIN